jgi:hypothetical protein
VGCRYSIAPVGAAFWLPELGSQLELAIVEYIAWFNNTRLHENLGDRPPQEIEELYAVKSRALTTPS